MKLFSFTAIAFASLSPILCGAEFRVEKTPTGGVTIQVDGLPFAEYVVDQGNKPYLWPIFGPGGELLTRSFPMKEVEGEPHDHPHQRGLTFGLEDLEGTNTWAELISYGQNPEGLEKAKLVGSIRHKEYTQLQGGPNAAICALAEHRDPLGNPLATEERRMTFQSDQNTRSIDFNLDLIASQRDIKIEDKKDSGMSIRVAHSMCVDAKEGGTIVNSNGQKDADAWGKRATWCDFSGPVKGERVGIAILNHPTSFRHPTPWHARTYGLFTANPFGPAALDPSVPSGTFVLKKGDRIRLRHRIIFHRGDEQQAGIPAAFDRYAAESPDMPTAPPAQ